MIQLLTEQYLRDNIAEESHNGAMELLSQGDASICVWDNDDAREITFYFLEKMNPPRSCQSNPYQRANP